MKYNYYILHCLSTLCMLTSIRAASNVSVTCVTCPSKSSTFRAPLGGELTIKYHVNASKFIDITIYYNDTQEIAFNPSVLNKQGVRDKRFIIPDKVFKENDGTISLNITLTNLSADDDGAVFRYKYQDNDFYRWAGSNKLIVTGSIHTIPSRTTSTPVTAPGKRKTTGNENLLFIVIAVLAVLILCVLILTGVCCYCQWRRRRTRDSKGSKALYSAIEMDDERRTEIPTNPHRNSPDRGEESDDADDGYLHPIDSSNEESDTIENNNTPVPMPPKIQEKVSDPPVNVESDPVEGCHEYEYIDTTELVKHTDATEVTPSTSRKKFEACDIDTSGGKFADYVQTGNAAVYKQPSSVPKFNPPGQPPTVMSPDESEPSTLPESDLARSTISESDLESSALTDRASESPAYTDSGSEPTFSPELSTESAVPSLSDTDTPALDSPDSNDTADTAPPIISSAPPDPIYAIVNKEDTIYEAPQVAPSEYESLSIPMPIST